MTPRIPVVRTSADETCSVQLKLPGGEDYLTLRPGDRCQNPVRGEDKVCLDEWYGRNSNLGIVYHLRYLANETTADSGLYRLLLNSNGKCEKKKRSSGARSLVRVQLTFNSPREFGSVLAK